MYYPLKKLFVFNNDDCFDFKTVPRLEGKWAYYIVGIDILRMQLI